MKYFLIVVLLTFSLNVVAQSGIYAKEPLTKDGSKLKWRLIMHEDGTFLYHFFRDLSAISKANEEEHFYGKGTWILDGKSVIFHVKENDLSGKYTVNLNNSKARYIIKSPRDKSDSAVKTALLFYESETFHIKGLQLYKE